MMRRTFATSPRVRLLQSASLLLLLAALGGMFVHSFISQESSHSLTGNCGRSPIGRGVIARFDAALTASVICFVGSISFITGRR